MKPPFGIFAGATCAESPAGPAGSASALFAVLVQLGFGLGGLLPTFEGALAGGDEARADGSSLARLGKNAD